jgi:hypothetical protein
MDGVAPENRDALLSICGFYLCHLRHLRLLSVSICVIGGFYLRPSASICGFYLCHLRHLRLLSVSICVICGLISAFLGGYLVILLNARAASSTCSANARTAAATVRVPPCASVYRPSSRPSRICGMVLTP